VNDLIKQLADKASDAGALARSISDSGIQSVSEMFSGIRIFGAVAATSSEKAEQDETHYLLVPLLGEPRRYAVYTKRILPPDTGAINSLTKARIFHLPDETGISILEQKLVESMVSERLDPESSSSDLADTLEKVADQIDKETEKLSGGLILIGGAVALVNPLLGVGIAVKGLFPSIGAKASKAGAEYVGNKLRDWNKSSSVSKLRKQANAEVRKLKPIIYPNPILRSLDVIATNPQSDFEPAFDHRNWIDQFEPYHYYTATTEAIHEVYQGVLGSVDARTYRKSHLDWIGSFLSRT
jgi:hypothetical protein